MAERHWRCRYFPHCLIHQGARLQADVTLKERIAIAEDYWATRQPGRIAREHDLTERQVYRIARQVRRRSAPAVPTPAR